MSRVRTLLFHPALAPYRVDFFNEVAKELDLKVVFLQENLVSQKFDQDSLRSRLNCEYEYLTSGVNVLGRQIRLGLGRAISNFKPDVVVCNEYGPTTILVALLKLLHVNLKFGLTIMTDDNRFICDKSKVARRVARNVVLRHSDSIVVTNEATKTWYDKYDIPSENIGVCPIIQKESCFQVMLKAGLPVAERYIRDYGLIGKRVLLFVGRLVKIKGVNRIIKAFAEVVKSFPDAVLVIVGDGPEKKSIEDLVSSQGIGAHVRIVGRFEGNELLAWYLIGQVFVIASSFEPYGSVINEALLAGMPVLCSSRAGAADLIRPGQNGCIFDPYYVFSLSGQMKNILTTISLIEDGGVLLRKNLMPISFGDAVRGFVKAVECAVQETA